MEAGEKNRAYWARVWAKAILEARKGNPSFKTKLETDPLLAERKFRADLGLEPDSRPLVSDMILYEEDMEVEKFSEKDVPDLLPIINENLKVKINPNELKKKLQG